MDIFFASHFGHTRKIAGRLADLISASGVPSSASDIAESYPNEAKIRSDEPCVLISAVRYGKHLPIATKLLGEIAPLTPKKPLVLLSVNLTARKPQKRSATGNTYVRKWIAKSGAKPVLAEAIAGNLDYPRYNFFDKTMIRFIMSMSDGPTDGVSVIDYTPWAHVEELARKISEIGR